MSARRKICRWKARFHVIILMLAYANAQDISSCCEKATDDMCRNVCHKMSLLKPSNSSKREERIQNIYKFCEPGLTEFWICMNQTVQEILSGSTWWGSACCAKGHYKLCRDTCALAANTTSLMPVCRKSDEISLFKCVERQEQAQACCSQTHSLACQEACQQALWHNDDIPMEPSVRERALDACEQYPELLKCYSDIVKAAPLVHVDTSKHLACCHEKSLSPECQNTCRSVLQRTGELSEISNALYPVCGPPSIQNNPLYLCFLKMDSTTNIRDFIPYDIPKLHCCYKAKTPHCRKLCFNTFYSDWQKNWFDFYSDCIGNTQEEDLTQCVEEVEQPCSLGCGGLTYCSQLNERPTTLFRACSAQADLDAHYQVVQQRDKGFVNVAGFRLPLRNSSQCSPDVWKSVACALHVKPCTPVGHSSRLCAEDCTRVVSSCVDWAHTPPQLSAYAVCARLTPQNATMPCVTLTEFMSPSQAPALLSAAEAVTSPCGGAACPRGQTCVVSRGSLRPRYSCVDGCALGEGSSLVAPLGSVVRVPMPGPADKLCYKLCRCGPRGLNNCQPLLCLPLETCHQMEPVPIPHGYKYYMECNPCRCVLGERVCSERACGRSTRLTGLPCNCPPHHVPVRTAHRLYPNACLAKCAGARDAEIDFSVHSPCGGVTCGRRQACLPAPRVCLSMLTSVCPAHVCVNTSNCDSQPPNPVCDTDGGTHHSPCALAQSGRRFAYWGACLHGCSNTAMVCGVNGVTYKSECAAWAEYVSVDYLGPCYAVGPISDQMEPKCQIDRIVCPPLKRPRCLGFTAPGACCPKCGGAIRILYSKKQIDRAIFANISSSAINLMSVLKGLENHVKIAECALRGYLTIEMEIFVTVESILQHPTDLQLEVCVLETEKIADLINRDSALLSTDLGLSALSYALPVHTFPTKGASSVSLSISLLMLSFIFAFIIR